MRIDLGVKAKDGKEVIGMVNNFLNDPAIGVGKITLMGMTMINDEGRPQQAHQPTGKAPLLDVLSENPQRFVGQEGTGDVFRRLIDSVRSNSGFVIGLDTPVKLVRSLAGLTKENLIYWEKKGYIHPEMVRRGAKKGRVFPTSEAFKVAYIWQFHKEGYGLPTAAKMADQELFKIKESQPDKG